jgi:prepilin-type N-terminal cleavage/methylation domain-containing protein
MRRYINHNGFTLVELAVVLVIIGMLVGMGASMIGPITNLAKVRETRDMQDASIQAIVSWASSRNMLPNAVIDPLDVLYPDSFSTVAKNIKDAWNQNLLYLYDVNLNPSTNKDTICGRRTTSLKLWLESGTISNIAFMIISRADNADNNAFKSTFTADAPAPSFGADASYDGAVDKIIEIPTSGPKSGITPSGYAKGTIKAIGSDPVTIWTNPDIIRWVTLDELRSKIGCQGAPLKILNNELPVGNKNDVYNATIKADGGVQFTSPDVYRWCVQTTSGTSPAGLSFRKLDAFNAVTNITNVANLFQTNCVTYAVANWPQAGQLVLSSTPPTTSDSYFFTVYVSDDNANTSSKPFVLTFNP